MVGWNPEGNLKVCLSYRNIYGLTFSMVDLLGITKTVLKMILLSSNKLRRFYISIMTKGYQENQYHSNRLDEAIKCNNFD